MIYGAISIPAGISRVPQLANWVDFLVGVCYVLATCMGSGALGAIVSVMERITRGKRLDVDVDQTKVVKVLAGGFRPLIGAAFGAALFVLIRGHLLPLTLPPDDRTALFYFGGLAFIAGFSERWAQDTIVRSAPRVPSGSGQTDDGDAARSGKSNET